MRQSQRTLVPPALDGVLAQPPNPLTVTLDTVGWDSPTLHYPFPFQPELHSTQWGESVPNPPIQRSERH